ncbi:MAG: hypothetical protein IPP17_17615 [Bacteroidetes bacterium]|nr:hypothetical protein [Bacteroidota bacterium]
MNNFQDIGYCHLSVRGRKLAIFCSNFILPYLLVALVLFAPLCGLSQSDKGKVLRPYMVATLWKYKGTTNGVRETGPSLSSAPWIWPEINFPVSRNSLNPSWGTVPGSMEVRCQLAIPGVKTHRLNALLMVGYSIGTLRYGLNDDLDSVYVDHRYINGGVDDTYYGLRPDHGGEIALLQRYHQVHATLRAYLGRYFFLEGGLNLPFSRRSLVKFQKEQSDSDLPATYFDPYQLQRNKISDILAFGPTALGNELGVGVRLGPFEWRLFRRQQAMMFDRGANYGFYRLQNGNLEGVECAVTKPTVFWGLGFGLGLGAKEYDL